MPELSITIPSAVPFRQERALDRSETAAPSLDTPVPGDLLRIAHRIACES